MTAPCYKQGAAKSSMKLYELQIVNTKKIAPGICICLRPILIDFRKVQQHPFYIVASFIWRSSAGEIHTLWEAEHQADVSLKTMDGYAAAWRHMQELASIKMKDIRTEHIQDLIDQEVQAGRSRSQCEKIRALYSQICQYAMKKDIIDRNYAAFLRMPRQKGKKRLTLSDIYIQEDVSHLRAEMQNISGY